MDALTRAGYLAHARSPAHVRRVTEAQAIISAHPGYAVSTSWGKDSVAMLSIAAAIDPRITIIYGRYQTAVEVFEDVDDVRDAVLTRLEMRDVRYVETTIPGAWEIFGRVGAPFVVPETPAQREAVRWWRSEFEVAMDMARRNVGATGVMMGLRGHESRNRSYNIAMRGLSYRTASGRATALPMGHWTGADIWARLVNEGLPWLRIYDVSPDRERARSDFCWAAGGSSEHLMRGEFLNWRSAYPEQIAAWLHRWPQLGALADCNLGAIG